VTHHIGSEFDDIGELETLTLWNDGFELTGSHGSMHPSEQDAVTYG
jgi:hypothetical protein